MDNNVSKQLRVTFERMESNGNWLRIGKKRVNLLTEYKQVAICTIHIKGVQEVQIQWLLGYNWVISERKRSNTTLFTPLFHVFKVY